MYTTLSFIAGLVFLNAVAQDQAGSLYVSLDDIMRAMNSSPLIWPLLLVDALSAAGSAILLLYHLLYVVPRMTSTQELFKKDADPSKWVKHHPDDRLSFWKNLEYLLLNMRVPASLMGDMRTPVVFQDFKKTSKKYNADFVKQLACNLEARPLTKKAPPASGRHVRALSYTTHSMVSHRLNTSRPILHLPSDSRHSLPASQGGQKLAKSEAKRGKRRRRAEMAYSTSSSKPVV